MLKSEVEIYGIWDDHDYGKDNSDGTFLYKDLSRVIFLDFLDEPDDSIRRHRKGGIF